MTPGAGMGVTARRPHAGPEDDTTTGALQPGDVHCSASHQLAEMLVDKPAAVGTCLRGLAYPARTVHDPVVSPATHWKRASQTIVARR